MSESSLPGLVGDGRAALGDDGAEPKAAFVEDLDRHNGTGLRGERIEAVSEIQPGDTVRVGPEVIQFVPADRNALTVAD